MSTRSSHEWPLCFLWFLVFWFFQFFSDRPCIPEKKTAFVTTRAPRWMSCLSTTLTTEHILEKNIQQKWPRQHYHQHLKDVLITTMSSWNMDMQGTYGCLLFVHCLFCVVDCLCFNCFREFTRGKFSLQENSPRGPHLFWHFPVFST